MIAGSKRLVATSVISSLLGFLVILFGERIAFHVDPPWSERKQVGFMLQQARLKMFLKKELRIPFSSYSGKRKPDIALPILRVAPAVLFSVGLLVGLILIIRRECLAAAAISVIFNIFGAFLFFQGGLLQQ